MYLGLQDLCDPMEGLGLNDFRNLQLRRLTGVKSVDSIVKFLERPKGDFSFYRYVWSFNTRVLPLIERAIVDHQCEDRVTRLYTFQEVQAFLEGFD